MDEEGEICLSEEKVPCILKGVNMAIICSDEITLTSHLVYQGVRWQEVFPISKTPNLN